MSVKQSTASSQCKIVSPPVGANSSAACGAKQQAELRLLSCNLVWHSHIHARVRHALTVSPAALLLLLLLLLHPEAAAVPAAIPAGG
jgi:hypothetical protein